MQRIFVVTHPQADHHVQGVVGGWHDSHLTEKGHRDAAAIAARLVEEIGDAPVVLHSSDLARTRETAAPIAEALGVTAQLTPKLRELSLGVAGGKPQAWLEERFVPAPHENRLDHANCEGAETKRTFATRVAEAVDEIVRDPTETKVIVTHGYAMTFVLAAWVRMPIEAMGYINVKSTSGGITLLEEDDFLENRALVRVNDTTHLT
ncbi:MAG: histidine phosphatase family protein [Acidobacteriota bacterium]